MTNLEKMAIQSCANRLKELASLENCALDEEIKRKIRLYMTWFDCVANDLEEIVKLADNKGYWKKCELEEIIRLNQ